MASDGDGDLGKCDRRGMGALLLVGLAACCGPSASTGGSLHAAVPVSASLPSQSGEAGFAVAGRTETALQVILPTPRPAHPPLVIAFHGTGGEPAEVANDFDLQARADALGFAAIAPRAGYREQPHPPDVD